MPHGKEKSRNYTRRSVSWWWNGIFWRKPPVGECGPEAPTDRSGSPRSVDRAPVRAARGQPLDVLPGTGAGDGVEPDADAADRRAVSGDPLVWISSDGAASAPPGSRGWPRTSAAADGEDWPGGDLPAAEDDGSTSGASDLPVSSPRHDD